MFNNSTNQIDMDNLVIDLNKMETFSKLRPPDAVRIKVKIVDRLDDNSSINSNMSRMYESKKFCVDPQITSYDILTNLIAQAFAIREEFQMSYLNREFSNSTSNSSSFSTNFNKDSDTHEYMSLFNDWDLDAAFLNSSNPYLSINVVINSPHSNISNNNNTTSSKDNCQIKNNKVALNEDVLLPMNDLSRNNNRRRDTNDHSVNDTSANYEEWDVISSNDIKLQQIHIEQQNKKNLEKYLNNSMGRSNTNYNVMNLDANGRSMIALWSSQVSDKAVSVFQKMMNGISRSSSFNVSSMNNNNNNGNSKKNSLFDSKFSGRNYSFNFSSSNGNDPRLINHHLNSLRTPLNVLELSRIESLIKAKQPIGDTEFRNFLDSDGRVVTPLELRQRIYDGGCDASRRKELWPILLDIYPNQMTMTSQQRNEFVKIKTAEYEQLKASLWHKEYKSLIKLNKQSNQIPDSNLSSLANKIQKDVWRTDRYHRFFSGDSNKNIESLFNILMTYSLANGGFYAQGMSDLLSPLLFVLREEGLSYICFCSLMKRCLSNFDINSEAIASKIRLLSALIRRYDPDFWIYLTQVGAEQLLFVYRWLLIECKREFPFNDSLRVLEVMWSTLEPTNSEHLTDSFYNFGRSNSNASSINLRQLKSDLLKNRNGSGGSSNCGGVEDDLMSDVEYSDNILESSLTSTSNERYNNKLSTPNKSRHQSQQSQMSQMSQTSSSNNNNNNNNDEHNSMCEVCLSRKCSKIKRVEPTETTTTISTEVAAAALEPFQQNQQQPQQTKASLDKRITSEDSADDDGDDSESESDSESVCCSSSSSSDILNDSNISIKQANRQKRAMYWRELAMKRRRNRRRYFSLNLLMDKLNDHNLICKLPNLVKTTTTATTNENNKSFTKPTKTSSEKSNENLNSKRRSSSLDSLTNIHRSNTTNVSGVNAAASTVIATSAITTNSKPIHFSIKNTCSIKNSMKRRSLSTNCIDCLISSTRKLSLKRNSSQGNLIEDDENVNDANEQSKKNSFNLPNDSNLKLINKRNTMPIIKINRSNSPNLVMASSVNARISTSEAETITLANNLRNSLTQQSSFSPMSPLATNNFDSLIRKYEKWPPTPFSMSSSLNNQNKIQKCCNCKHHNRRKIVTKSTRKSSPNNSVTQNSYSTKSSSKATSTTTDNDLDLTDNNLKQQKRKFRKNLRKQKNISQLNNDIESSNPQHHQHQHHHLTNPIKSNENAQIKSQINNLTNETPIKADLIEQQQQQQSKIETKQNKKSTTTTAAQTTCSCSNSLMQSRIIESKESKSSNENKDVSNLSNGVDNNFSSSKLTTNSSPSLNAEHKNSVTSSKSSTSVCASRASVASSASSLSSNCSTPFGGSKLSQNPIIESKTQESFKSTTNYSNQSNQSTKLLHANEVIVPILPPSTPSPTTNNFDDEDEEELIYLLSKQDNPFLLFICFSIFIEHRDHIMRNQMDANDIACYFDKMTRKHNMKTILNRARYLYSKLYLSKTNVFNYIQQLNEIQNSP